MTKINSPTLDVINVYRSKSANSTQFVMDFSNLFNPKHATLVVGDFNLCSKSEKKHTVLQFMEREGFVQLVDSPTHLEGRQIDQVFMLNPEQRENKQLAVKQQSPFYTDHDILYVHEVGIA